MFADTLIALALRNRWSNVSILFGASRLYYVGIAHAFKEQLLLSNGTIDISLSSISAVYDTYIPLEEIQMSGSRITILLVGPDQLSRILCFGFHNKLFFDTHQFVVVSRTLSEIEAIKFTYDKVQYSCDEEHIRIAVNRTIIIHYRLDPFDTTAVTDSGLTYDQFIALYPGEVETYNANLVEGEEKLESSFWATSYFDAVWSLALALNNSRADIFTRTGKSLSQYRYGDTVATDIIKKSLLQLDYNGVSGRIRFDESTGYVIRPVDIYQVLNNTMFRVKYFNGTDIAQLGDVSLEYIEDSFPLMISRAPASAGAVFMIASLVGFALIIVGQVIVVVYRNHHSVKAVSPKLLHVAFIGTYFLNLTCILYIIAESFPVSPEVECGTFQTLNTTAMIGMTLHYLNPGILITDKVLFTYIGLLVFIQVPVLVAWVIIEPLSPFVEPFRDQGLYTIRCKTTYYHLWWGALLGYNYILIFGTFFIALRCQGIQQRDFKTNSIIVIVYLLTFITILGFPSYFFLPISSNLLPEFLVLNATILIILYLSIFLHLWVPIWPIMKTKFDNAIQSRQNNAK